MASDPVTVSAPTVCPTCSGEGWVWANPRPDLVVEVPCPVCACQMCGSAYDVLNGECGSCFDEADRYESRKADR